MRLATEQQYNMNLVILGVLLMMTSVGIIQARSHQKDMRSEHNHIQQHLQVSSCIVIALHIASALILDASAQNHVIPWVKGGIWLQSLRVRAR